MFKDNNQRKGFVVSGNPLLTPLVKIAKFFQVENLSGSYSKTIYQLNNDIEVGYEASWLINYFSLKS